MKQVPNPLPKVLSRRGVGAGLEAAERESFERTQVRIEGGPRGISGASLETRRLGRCWKGGRVLQAQERTGQGGREEGHLARGLRRSQGSGPGDTPAGLGSGRGGGTRAAEESRARQAPGRGHPG